MSKVRILSPRPEINKNAAVNAVFLFILVELLIQTTKFFCRVRIFPSVWRELCQTCGAFLTILLHIVCKIYLLSPRPRNSKPSHSRRFFICLQIQSIFGRFGLVMLDFVSYKTNRCYRVLFLCRQCRCLFVHLRAYRFCVDSA